MFSLYYLYTNTAIKKSLRKIAKLEQQVQWLISQIRLAKHKQFGASSEKTDETQLSIFNEAEYVPI